MRFGILFHILIHISSTFSVRCLRYFPALKYSNTQKCDNLYKLYLYRELGSLLSSAISFFFCLNFILLYKGIDSLSLCFHFRILGKLNKEKLIFNSNLLKLWEINKFYRKFVYQLKEGNQTGNGNFLGNTLHIEAKQDVFDGINEIDCFITNLCEWDALRGTTFLCLSTKLQGKCQC